MFRAVEMQAIRIVGHLRNLDEVLEEVHNIGVVEIRQAASEYFERGRPLESFSVISDKLAKARMLESYIGRVEIDEPLEELERKKLLERCDQIVEPLYAKVHEMQKKLEEIKKEIRETDEKLKILYELGMSNLEIDFSSFRTKSTTVYLGKIPLAKFQRLRTELSKLAPHEVFSWDAGLYRACVVVMDRRFNPSELFDRVGFIDYSYAIPEEIPKRIVERYTKRRKELENEKENLIEDIGSAIQKHKTEIPALREMLEIEANRAEIVAKFGFTKRLFVLEGWVPKSKLGDFEKITEKYNALLQKISPKEIAPTLLQNPKPIKPFEFMVEFVYVPRSNELDPTVVFAIFFPIIYGMMLGDVGYGIASLLIAIFVMRKFREGLLNAIARAWAYAALPTIFFGILYDEYFGFSHASLLGLQHPLYHGIERMHNIETLLVIMIMVGMVHVAIGFLLGFINEWGHDRLHALAKLGWIGVEIAGFVIVSTALFGFFDSIFILPAAILGLISLVPIVKSEGIVGIVEIPSVGGNILSYSRILAVGLASVVVAVIINDMLKPDFSSPLVVLTLPAFIICHLLNIVIGMFESLIQGARLNYVEFFTKFFHGGGRKFSPFAYERKYTVPR
ncbi:MAG: V-type ATP synthase subunit I [Candidatus Micrarchaeia archaeon]